MMKKMKKINIFNISRLKTYTDGDGISTLVGCTGCPLRCAYCLNPYSWDRSVESYNLTAEELFDKIKIDNLYFLSTGGGVVFGGGEPLIYSKFIQEFINEYKSTGWKFGLETSLSTNNDHLKDIIGLIDFYIVDTKDMNRQRYESYTLGDYDLFIDNLKYLRDNVESEKIKLRVPKIPGLHASNEVNENQEILRNMGFENIEMFNYIKPELRMELSEVAFNRLSEFLNQIK